MLFFQKISFRTLFAALALMPLLPAVAEENAAQPVINSHEPDSKADKAGEIRDLLFGQTFDSEEDFTKALKEAEALGASGQLLLEAEIARVVIQNGAGDAGALAKRLEAFGEKWDAENAVGLRGQKTVTLFLHLLKAKDAVTKKDLKTFRAEAAEAAWIEPGVMQLLQRMNAAGMSSKTEQMPEFVALDKAIAEGAEEGVRKAFIAAIWADVPVSQDLAISKIQSWRAKQAAEAKAKKAADLVIPFDVKLEQAVGDPVTLKGLLKDKKAILLDFHASWCGPCMQSMPMLPKEAEQLIPQGVAVAAFNTESSADAEKIQKRFNLPVPVLVGKGTPYAELFDVDSIPRYVLISAGGKVLFNGHPADHKALASALEKIGVKLGVPATSSPESADEE